VTPLLLLLLSVGPEWKKLDTVDGIAIFSRELPKERLVELKLTTTSRASVEKLCTAAFGTAALDPEEPAISARKLIRESETERVTYDQIKPPLVSARDYAVRSKKESMPNGGCRLIFTTANELAPPTPEGFVRIEKLWGSWEFESVGGSTRATYTIFTDPGGSIPATFIEGSRQRTALAWVKLVLKRASR
jgi:hypothetical protein